MTQLPRGRDGSQPLTEVGPHQLQAVGEGGDEHQRRCLLQLRVGPCRGSGLRRQAQERLEEEQWATRPGNVLTEA
jgi:hypothetical protein